MRISVFVKKYISFPSDINCSFFYESLIFGETEIVFESNSLVIDYSSTSKKVSNRIDSNDFRPREMEVVDIKIQVYEERISLLEKKVSDLEKSNLVLEKMMDKNITFSSNVSKIIFKMDCLLAQKNDQIRKLESEIKNMAESLTAIPSDFSMNMFNEHSSQIEVLDVITMPCSDESNVDSCATKRNHESLTQEPDIKMEPVYEYESEIRSEAIVTIENANNGRKNDPRSHMIILDYEKIVPKRNSDGVFVCANEMSRLNSKPPSYDGSCPYKTPIKSGFLEISY